MFVFNFSEAFCNSANEPIEKYILSNCEKDLGNFIKNCTATRDVGIFRTETCEFIQGSGLQNCSTKLELFKIFCFLEVLGWFIIDGLAMLDNLTGENKKILTAKTHREKLQEILFSSMLSFAVLIPSITYIFSNGLLPFPAEYIASPSVILLAVIYSARVGCWLNKGKSDKRSEQQEIQQQELLLTLNDSSSDQKH